MKIFGLLRFRFKIEKKKKIRKQIAAENDEVVVWMCGVMTQTLETKINRLVGVG